MRFKSGGPFQLAWLLHCLLGFSRQSWQPALLGRPVVAGPEYERGMRPVGYLFSLPDSELRSVPWPVSRRSSEAEHPAELDQPTEDSAAAISQEIAATLLEARWRQSMTPQAKGCRRYSMFSLL